MRIPEINPADASPSIREALEALPPLSLFRAVAHAEGAFGPWLAFGGALLSQLELDPGLRELAILQVAHQEGSDYEWAQHVVIAERLGVRAAQIAAIEAGLFDEAVFEEGERLALAAVREIGIDGAGSVETVEALASVLGTRALVEFILVVGHYTSIARLVATLDISVDPAADLAVVELADGQR
jgi:alkylhydroperoxidase family enzyme